MSLSRNHLKLITSLRQKKYRLKHKMFVAEGVKVVNEFLSSSFNFARIYCTDASYNHLSEVIHISEEELKKASQLSTPNKVLAIFHIPEEKEIEPNGLTLALDSINDPGNLGTIIRLCDWFGISNIVCSHDTVDCFNAKVVQASMGSLTRVKLHYTELNSFLEQTHLPKFIADMDGENVYQTSLPEKAILIMGNEANGVSVDVRKQSNHILTIPRFGDLQQTESLNVAAATAILLSEFRR